MQLEIEKDLPSVCRTTIKMSHLSCNYLNIFIRLSCNQYSTVKSINGIFMMIYNVLVRFQSTLAIQIRSNIILFMVGVELVSSCLLDGFENEALQTTANP